MLVEVWVDIPNTANKYQVSNLGRIRSFIKGEYRERKVQINSHGYPNVMLCSTAYRIHRIVAQIFIPNTLNLPLVLHIDDNKKNCVSSNLKWGTSEENNRDALQKGINTPAKGVQRKKSMLTESDVLKIYNSKETCRETADKYGVNHTCIVDIRSGRSWNHITGKPCTRKIKPKYSRDIKFI